MIQTLLSVALGGAIGAATRYLVNLGALRVLGAGFPWATLIVNVLGSLAMGVLFAAFAGKDPGRWQAFLMTGILGGFTTFSAFSLDTVLLWQRGAVAPAAIYVGASVILSLAALLAGMALARGVFA